VSVDLREGYADENRQEQERAGRNTSPEKRSHSLLGDARARGPRTIGLPIRHAPIISGHSRLQSRASGAKSFPTLTGRLFFTHWNARHLSKIFEQEGVGPQGERVFDDGRKLLIQSCAERLLEARAVIGFFPANSRPGRH